MAEDFTVRPIEYIFSRRLGKKKSWNIQMDSNREMCIRQSHWDSLKRSLVTDLGEVQKSLETRGFFITGGKGKALKGRRYPEAHEKGTTMHQICLDWGCSICLTPRLSSSTEKNMKKCYLEKNIACDCHVKNSYKINDNENERNKKKKINIEDPFRDPKLVLRDGGSGKRLDRICK